MRRKKSYVFRKDAYYFKIKTSPRDITIFRPSKEAASDVFERYLSVGKKLEWLGKWTGKKFEEANAPVFQK